MLEGIGVWLETRHCQLLGSVPLNILALGFIMWGQSTAACTQLHALQGWGGWHDK
jgi:hypothetical protein